MEMLVLGVLDARQSIRWAYAGKGTGEGRAPERSEAGGGSGSRVTGRDDPWDEDLPWCLRCGITRILRAMFKRQSAIEPEIGYMRVEGKLVRNWLKDKLGDALNVMLCSAGYNVRMILRKLRLFCILILAAVRGENPVLTVWALRRQRAKTNCSELTAYFRRACADERVEIFNCKTLVMNENLARGRLGAGRMI